MPINKEVNKHYFERFSGISTAFSAKLGKGENSMTEVLLKICRTFSCDITAIMEIEKEQPP